MAKVKGFKELDVWQLGIEIANQMQRAAVSIPSNIAEGYGRHYTKEYIRFLRVAMGSCAELETQLVISQKRHLEDCRTRLTMRVEC